MELGSGGLPGSWWELVVPLVPPGRTDMGQLKAPSSGPRGPTAGQAGTAAAPCPTIAGTMPLGWPRHGFSQEGNSHETTVKHLPQPGALLEGGE